MDGHEVPEKMLDTISQGNPNLKPQDMIMYLLEWLKFKKNLTISSIGKDVVQVETSEVADGDIRWHNHFGKQFGKFLNRQTCTYPMIQPFHSYIFTQENESIYSCQDLYIHFYNILRDSTYITLLKQQEMELRCHYDRKQRCQELSGLRC